VVDLWSVRHFPRPLEKSGGSMMRQARPCVFAKRPIRAVIRSAVADNFWPLAFSGVRDGHAGLLGSQPLDF
jgi:hypothetical protein